MAWKDNRVQNEYEKFVQEDEAQQEQMYERLAEQLEAAKAGRYPTGAIEARMSAIAANYPQVMAKILSRTMGRAVERLQEVERLNLTKKLVSQKDANLN
jgi:hypothetical protein